MDATVQKISGKVDSLRDELVAFLSRLVQFPSLPGQEQAAQQFYADQLRGLSLDTQIIPSRKEELESHPAFCDDGVPFDERLNVIGRWPGTGKKGKKKEAPRTLILNGHMDVVPTGSESLWSRSPWSGEVKESKLYGRGSCDMKAGLAANLFAVRVLQSLGFRPAADVLLESVIGEESGGVGTLTTIVKGFKADAAIITEPTRLHVCPVQSGAMTFRIEVSGRAIHACMKPHGESAIEKFYPRATGGAGNGAAAASPVQELPLRRPDQHRAHQFRHDSRRRLAFDRSRPSHRGGPLRCSSRRDDR